MPLHLTLAPHSRPVPIHAALIDLDGTLIDTLGDFSQAIALTLAELGLAAVPSSAIALMVGKGTEHLLHSVLVHSLRTEPDAALLARTRAIYLEHYRRLNGQFSAPYPGALQGLRALHAAGIPLVCLTNKPLALAQPLLQAKGMTGYFQHIFGGDSFERKKPDPLPLIQACRTLGLPCAQVLMVGDSSNDAQAARAAGCPIVLMRYGYNHGQPIENVDADGYWDRLDALLGSQP